MVTGRTAGARGRARMRIGEEIEGFVEED